ncbi:MAG: histidinol-phosphatase [Rhodospirillales bacterium]|nr:histidinol-phosphatase [Rhodospirillales bacterium]
MTEASGAEAFTVLAHKLADAAGPILAGYFRQPNPIEFKSDRSPVSAADREAEGAMRAILEREAPQHGIYGEEMGRVRSDAEWQWVLDPLDGTASFITGKPLFGTLIGLARNGTPVLGIIDQPILKERWIGVAGRETLCNGKPVKTRAAKDIGSAFLYATTPQMFEGANSPAFERLRQGVRRAVWGAECYAYGMLSSGYVDIVCEADLKPYDYTAVVPVIEGAGGTISDWQGKAVTLATDGRILAAADGALHREALRLLAGS